MKKSEWKEFFLDTVGEIVFYLVLFGLGALVLALFGIGVDAMDGDLVMLIGIGVLALLGGVIWAAEILLKKKRVSGKTDENADNNDSHI